MIENKGFLVGIEKRKKRYNLILCIILLMLLSLICINMTLGTNATYPLSDVFKVLMGQDGIKGAYIIKNLRLPRTIAAVFCGIAFGVAGNTFQTLLRNPLASPDIIGVSTGSTVAAVYGILYLHASNGAVSVMALISGLAAAGAIYWIATKGGYSGARLILTGIGAQAFFTALINWMVLKGAEYDVPSAMRWMTGNLNDIKSDGLPLLIFVVIIITGGIMFMGNILKGLELGDAYATVLGINVNLSRIIIIILAVVLIAFATSVTGPISSIAFLSGPIATRICGKRQTNTVSAGLVGACIVLAADFVGQNLLPTRYPVGVITGILGAPYLLYLLININKGEKV
ncbi:iron complex transport system permease protein [Pseudobutyrivibrio sp. ACV-2]|uniref:FecCD family ABC transporter permease n=1 Tax=Pseudobutyrivibrio sp. ACV-2 TaxID=1520801 RepID=UPI000895DF23|nr:iron ABC transporter permease [Pseudobutyrivibrio sp. ACV-2]SDZ89423.1 iron complex transport system permease protein [Pseudobutyrivibrio sp. ACV-2]